jgi:hypothetical protein
MQTLLIVEDKNDGKGKARIKILKSGPTFLSSVQ